MPLNPSINPSLKQNSARDSELVKLCITPLFLSVWLGFNGIITFRNAETVRDVADATPTDRIVLETDAPYLTPVPYRGQPNEPRYLPFIAETLAGIKKLDTEVFLEHARRNSYQLFF